MESVYGKVGVFFKAGVSLGHDFIEIGVMTMGNVSGADITNLYAGSGCMMNVPASSSR